MINVIESHMSIAIKEAEKAFADGEVPVGAALFLNDELISHNHNRVLDLNDPTAHAELLVISDAARKIGNYRLKDAKLYVTLEPCPMCISAMIHARIHTVFFGAYNDKWGYMSKFNMDLSLWNHRIGVFPGILEKESSKLLKLFFENKRG